MNIVALVESENGDWASLYVNGLFEYEGHNIYSKDWINLINKYKHFDKVETYLVNSEWMDWRGVLPLHFKDIPSEMISGD